MSSSVVGLFSQVISSDATNINIVPKILNNYRIFANIITKVPPASSVPI